MDYDRRPAWSMRLEIERERRGWNKHETARRLLAAAGTEYPPVKSLAHQIRRWERGEHFPRDWMGAYATALDMTEEELFGADSAGSVSVSQQPFARDVLDLAAWVESANVGAGTLAFLDQETRRLTVDYAKHPPMTILSETSDLLQNVIRLLRERRQRVAQTRTLFRNAAQLLALLCLLAGDVGRYPDARVYGHTAWLCAEEADSDLHRALVLSSQSKTAKWERRYREAADLARQGYELSPPVEARILLASQEANALQALGDLAGAKDALTRAKRACDELTPQEESGLAWACPRPRQATYALQVALGAGDPAWMRREVAAADDAWSAGDPWVYGTWSQIRIGAGIAEVMAGELDAATEQVEPVLELPPELRVVTITGRLSVVEHQLAEPRYAGSADALELRDQIVDFRAGALRQRQTAPSEDP